MTGSPTIRVEVFVARVRSDGASVPVNPRERALLYALVAARRPVVRGELQATLWPDFEPAAARNALGVCLHRLRRQIGDVSAIVRTPAGYALGPQVSVDLWDAEDLERRLLRCQPLRAAERAAGRSLLATLQRAPAAATLPSGEAFVAFQLRAEAVRRNIALLLGMDALANGDTSAAIACADVMLAVDPCDEAACEIAMRAHLALGDRASAIRDYRAYQRAVTTELQLPPSPHLWTMLTA
jgi:DNA-binding SARP family transcriptional activator